MSERNFFAELKRRNVYKVAVAYGVFAWLIVQFATQVFPFFEIPNWSVRLVVLLLLLGSPVALVFAWVYEITPEGLKRTEDVAPGESIAHHTGRRLTAFTMAIVAIALAVVVFEFLRVKRSAHLTSEPARLSQSVEIPEKSIAVLPFQNLSDDKQNAYFADGVQDEVLTDLAQIADLKVISRMSVMQYRDTNGRNLREIGKVLGVSHVLEGTVQRAGNNVRVTAQLIDARSDTHVWAEHYDREVADLFGIQSDIAEQISDQLRAKLSPSEKAAIEKPLTKNPAAYDAYLRAKELLGSEQANWGSALREAESLLQKAIRADPAFLLAHCALARVHDRFYEYGVDRTSARLLHANQELKIASELGPDSGEVHLAEAGHLKHIYRDNDRAKDELALAATALPNNIEVLQILGMIQRSQGNWDEAARNLEKAVGLAPRNFELLEQLVGIYRPMHRYRELRSTFQREGAIPSAEFTARWGEAWTALEERADPLPAHMLLSEVSKRSGSERELLGADALFLALLERDRPAADAALALMPKEGLSSKLGPCPFAFYQGLAATCVRDAAGAKAAYTVARPAVEMFARANPDYGQALSLLALIDAGLDRKDDAIREGKRAIELLPVSKDAAVGADALFYLAAIYSQLNEKDLAIEQLEHVAKIPCAFTSYGWVKLLPIFDPLRGDPRFEKIVASLAPAAQPK